MERIRSEFQEGLDLMEKKNNSILLKYQELKGLFDRRPSRDEDVELIYKLKEEIILKDRQIKQYEDNIDYYKNELNNREENYNKIFNSKPTVGYIDPIKDKKDFRAPEKVLNFIIK